MSIRIMKFLDLIFQVFLFSMYNLQSSVHCEQITLSAANNYEPCQYVSELKMIDCMAPKFYEVPKIESSQEKPVRAVKIEFSDIRTIPQVFDGIKDTLEEFCISSSGITEISSYALQGLTKLKRLSIKSEGILSITTAISLKQMLSHLAQLEYVQLMGVKIEPIESDFLSSSVIKEFHLKKILNPISFHSHSFRIGGNSLEKLTLTQLKFTNPSSNFSIWLEHLTNIKELHFEECGLTKIPELPSTFTQLTFLNLDKNYIDNFEACSRLAYMKNSLKKLMLSNNNKIKSIDLSCINSLTELEVLDLRHNTGLTRIPPVVQILSKLETIILDNCGIQFIEYGHLRNEKLKLLSLSGNNLEYIESQVFDDLKHLETLILDSVNMPLTHVDVKKGSWDFVFKKLPSLSRLSMVDCNLDDLIWTQLLALPTSNLTYLYLNNNKITEIRTYFFASFQNIQELGLSQNKIVSLQNNSLYGLPSTIKSLRLEGNLLSTLNKCEFIHLNSYAGLKILNNPLICDCKIKWLVENASKNYNENLICKGPNNNPNNENKFLLKIPLSDLYCHDSSVKEPVCKTMEVFTPPIISTLKPPPSGNFTVKLLPVYNAESQSLTINIKLSDNILKIFDSAQLQFKSNRKSLKNEEIPFQLESKIEIQPVFISETFDFKVLLILDGKYYPYSYNNMSYTTPHEIKLGSQVIGGIAAGVIFFILLIIGVVLLIIFRNRRENMSHAKYKSDHSDAMSTTKTAEESIYDYDYPELDRTPKEFVRASTRSTVLTGFSQEPINGSSQNGISKNHHVSFFPMHPPSTNNRQTQSTSNLPHHYNLTHQRPATHRQQSYDPSVGNRNFHAPLKSISATILNPINPSIMASRELPTLPDQACDHVYPYERLDYNSSYLGMNPPVEEYWPSDGRSSPPPLPPPRHLDKPAASKNTSGLSRSDAILEHDRRENNFNNSQTSRRSLEESQPNSLFSDIQEGQNPAYNGSQGSERNSQTTLADVKDIGYF